MEETIISKEELVDMFSKQIIVDSGKGWIMNGVEVDIIALHDVDPKYLQDVTNAKYYKIKQKQKGTI